jgi:hypothetical protein
MRCTLRQRPPFLALATCPCCLSTSARARDQASLWPLPSARVRSWPQLGVPIGAGGPSWGSSPTRTCKVVWTWHVLTLYPTTMGSSGGSASDVAGSAGCHREWMGKRRGTKTKGRLFWASGGRSAGTCPPRSRSCRRTIGRCQQRGRPTGLDCQV